MGPSRAPTWIGSIPRRPPETPLDPWVQPFVAVIGAAGAEPVIEWGVRSGEVLGLEGARAFTGPAGVWLEIGIGNHDPLGHRLLWEDQPPVEAVSHVVEAALGAPLQSGPTP